MIKRYINIILPNKPFTVSNFDNVNIDNIDLIVNSSVDAIYCGILNKIPEQSVDNCIANLCSKVRPAGSLILGLMDIRNICKNFSDNRISNQEFIGLVNELYNVYFITDFEKLYKENLSKQFIVANTELKNNILTISLQRKHNG